MVKTSPMILSEQQLSSRNHMLTLCEASTVCFLVKQTQSFIQTQLSALFTISQLIKLMLLLV